MLTYLATHDGIDLRQDADGHLWLAIDAGGRRRCVRVQNRNRGHILSRFGLTEAMLPTVRHDRLDADDHHERPVP